MKLHYYVDAYLASLSSTHSPSTLKSYKKRLGKFTKELEQRNVDALNHLTREAVAGYQKIILNSETSGYITKSLDLQIVKQFLRFLHKNHYLFVDYSTVITAVKRPKGIVRKLSTEDYARIVATIPSSEFDRRAILALVILESLSVKSIQSLVVSDIDLEASQIRLRSKKKFKALHQETVTELKRYFIKRARLGVRCDWLFVHKKQSKQLVHSDVIKWFKGIS